MKKIAVLFCTASILVGCHSSLPERQSPENAAALRAFYIGLGALQVGDDVRAKEKLAEAVRLADGEPAAWTNLGVLQTRHKEFENAASSLEKAKQLAPDNAVVYSNIAVLETQRGNFEAAIKNLKKTIELAPNDLITIFALAQEYERQSDDEEALKLYSRISEARPSNIAIRLEIARLVAKTGDAKVFESVLSDVGTLKNKWPSEAQEQFDKAYNSTNDLRQGAIATAYLKNILLRDSHFRGDFAELKPSETVIGQPILKPLKLATPDFKTAEPDLGLRFTAKPLAEVKPRFAKAVFLNGDAEPVVAWSDEKEVRVGETSLPFAVESANGLAAFDFDYDFKNDISLAGEKGFRLFKQTGNGTFSDVTTQTKLPSAILQQSYAGVWPFDVESDGDLDLVLAGKSGPAVVLQNNSDGSFSELKPFGSLQRIVDFAWFDIDEDGDGDAVSLDDAGTLSFYRNERGGLFENRKDEEISGVTAIAVNDVFNSGRLILIAAKRDSSLFAIGDVEGKITPIQPLIFSISISGTRLLTGDLDNNGATDIISTRTASLSNGSGSFGGVVFDGDAFNLADLNSDGRLDLVGLDSTGRPATFTNSGTKNYHWQISRPRAQKVEGDQRVNSFGIGSEIEMRAGLRPQKRVVASPQVHFGLGEQTSADVMRVVWGNGFVQAEFELEVDQKIEAVQRLKGSCPHLFAWNGSEFAHVKDAPPWSPALGLKINAQDTYGILQTEEWFKIPGEALKPKNGSYELRITGEYWESFYLDNYKLLAIDHSEDTEIFTDERFSIPLPPLKVFTTGTTKPFANATDHNGRDVLETVAELDEKYLDGIKRGRFQGVAEDHFVELELPDDAPRDKKLWVVADGWMHPTDASINVQRGQQTDAKHPKSLSIEVEDDSGSWIAVKENLGFPAGKMKTILLDLSDVFTKDADRKRFRIRTELEVFWDKLAWAVDLDNVDNRAKALDLAEANLRYRGFSVIEKRDDSSPEVPLYDKILTTNQRWRDLEGYYTRFGDVKELLLNTDDRVVFMNAGDELILKFAALPEVEKGMKRDFVIIGNGWIKDGDLNSVFSKTLLPLPTQLSNDYSRRPTSLEDDPVYQRNKQDWVDFHTRYVSPTQFRDALR